MRVIVKQIPHNDTKGKLREDFEGYLAEFSPTYMSRDFSSWQPGIVFMLEGPLDHTKTNTGYHFDSILVAPLTLDNALGVRDD